MSWNTTQIFSNPWNTQELVSTPPATREQVQGVGASPSRSGAHRYPPSQDWGGAEVRPSIPLDGGWTAIPSPDYVVHDQVQADGFSEDWKTPGTTWIHQGAPHSDVQRTDAPDAVEQRPWATHTPAHSPIIPAQVHLSPWQNPATPGASTTPRDSGSLTKGVQNHPTLPLQRGAGLEESVSQGSQFNPWTPGVEVQVQEANPLQDMFVFSGSGVPSSQRLAKSLEIGSISGRKRGNGRPLKDTRIIKKRVLGDNPVFAIPVPKPTFTMNAEAKVAPEVQYGQPASEASGSPDPSGSNQVRC